MEGDIDQCHVSFIHSFLNVPAYVPGERPSVPQVQQFDTHPRFEIIDTDYGYVVGASRHTPDPELDYTRITQFLLPFHTMTGVTGVDPTRGWRAWVPHRRLQHLRLRHELPPIAAPARPVGQRTA